jgi:hypothetical protein
MYLPYYVLEDAPVELDLGQSSELIDQDQEL